MFSNCTERQAARSAFASAVAYDTLGRLSSQTYPTGLKVGYSYTPRGFTEKLTLATAATVNPLPATAGGTAPPAVSLPAGSVLWQGQVYDAWGHAEKQVYGNGVSMRNTFDPDGKITQIAGGLGTATNVLHHAYSWDNMGRLVSRGDANGDGQTGAVSDVFSYDALGRLTNYTVSAPQIPNLTRTVNLQYNALGQLLYKSDVGVYTYQASGPGAVRPHALLSVNGNVGTTGTANYGYDANGNLTTASDGKYRQISYTSFNLPNAQSGVQGAADTSAGTARYAWQYDEVQQRIKEVRTITGGGAKAGTRTTWMLHPDNAGGLGFESEVNAPAISGTANPAGTSNRHYLTVGGASIGVLVSSGSLPTLTSGQTAPAALSSINLVKVEYWHKDHLGSLAATTDLSGAVTARYAYDPFGKRRYTKGTLDASGNLVIDWSPATNNGTDRGFTGHEHLDDVGLVHMNGRLFDPSLGVFLQGDPFIQSPDNLQNYNRYAYCYNNPLTCTDPSGQRSFLGNLMRWSDAGSAYFFASHGDPLGAYINWWALTGKYGYQVKSVMIGVVSAVFCEGFAAVCAGVGQAVLSKAYGASDSDALRAGLISGVTAAAFTAAGTAAPGAGQTGATTGTVFANTVLHAAIGCASAEASGGECRTGALAAGFSAAYGNYASGDIKLSAYSNDIIVGTAQSAAVGGISSVLGGGKFGSGAVTSAFGYLFNQWSHNDRRGNGSKEPGWGYEYPADADHPFGPTEEFKARFFGSAEERQVWFRTQEIAAGTAQSRHWLSFDDPKVQLPRKGGPLYQIFDLGAPEAGAVRIAYSPKIPNVFYVSLDHYEPTPAQPLRWTKFEAAPPRK